MSKPRRIVAASQAPVISNTTPLINLVGVRHLDLLPALYGTITIANAVHNEYVAGKSPADPDLGALTWLQITPDVPRHNSLPPQLGAGEAGTLSLALAVNAQAVLLDEEYGRRIAQTLGLPVVGTLGVLLACRVRQVFADAPVSPLPQSCHREVRLRRLDAPYALGGKAKNPPRRRSRNRRRSRRRRSG
jgi:predicted nucleic acid-binding protein